MMGRKFRRPPWVALQVFLFTATIICALFGFIWDVSLHIGNGRDSGPLANPAHYFGLFLLFIAGTLAMVLLYDKPGAAALLLEYEGKRAMGPDASPDTRFIKFLQYLSFGGLFIGLSVFQIEYDFGVEQFRLVLQPMMIAGVGAMAAVAARLVLGPGAAIAAALPRAPPAESTRSSAGSCRV